MVNFYDNLPMKHMFTYLFFSLIEMLGQEYLKMVSDFQMLSAAQYMELLIMERYNSSLVFLYIEVF